MSTNEFLKEDTINRIKNSQNAPNGVMLSVGAGLTWVLPELFSELKPEFVLAFDYDPQVVLLGRLVVTILKKATDFEDFRRIVQSETEFNASNDETIEKTKNDGLKKLFNDIDVNSMRALLLRKINSVGTTETQTIKLTNVIDRFKINFEALKNLVLEDKIAFVFSDLLQHQTADLFNTALGEFKNSKNNVIYTSNIADYLGEKKLRFLNTLRGWHLSTSSASGYTVESTLLTKKKKWFQIFSLESNF